MTVGGSTKKVLRHSVSSDSSSDSDLEISSQPLGKSPASTKPSSNKKSKKEIPASTPKAGKKFSGQEKLHNWFVTLPPDCQVRVRDDIIKFIDDNSEDVKNPLTSDKSPCRVWKASDILRGIGKRTSDEGRLTFKPFVYLNNSLPFLVNRKLLTRTSKNDKGPEVNLATAYAFLHKLNANAESLVCSHRCHNKCCININHLCWETQELNNHRNFCYIKSCEHQPKCLIQGPNANLRGYEKKTVLFDANKKCFVNMMTQEKVEHK